MKEQFPTIRPGVVLALALIVAGCAEEDVTAPSDQVTELQILSGDLQVDTVGQQLREPLVVRAVDASERPVPGVAVSFVVVEGEGALSVESDTSDGHGEVRAQWTLGRGAGAQAVEARFSGWPRGKIITRGFRATAVPDGVARIAVQASSRVEARGDTIVLNETVQFRASAYDMFENLHSRSGFEWSVSDTGIATISPDAGLLTPVDTGEVVVWASKETVVGADTVRVRTVPEPPVAVITAPPDSTIFFETDYVDFEADASDPDGGVIGSIEWWSDRDGWLGSGVRLSRRMRSAGWYRVWVVAMDDERQTATSAPVVLRVESLPDLRIAAPRDGVIIPAGTPAEFVGFAVDRDGGDVEMTWRSDIDGVLGTGSPLARDDLAAGRHTVFLIGVDDEGQRDSVSIGIWIDDRPPGSPFALDFGSYGGSEFVEVPDAPWLDPQETWTLEGWVKPSTGGVSGLRHIIGKYWGSGSREASYLLNLEHKCLLLHVYDGTAEHIVMSSGVIVDGLWQHVAATFDHGLVKLYVNGVVEGTAEGVLSPVTTDGPLCLGHRLGEYDGVMDEVRVWNVVRSQSEIVEAMGRYVEPTAPGLVGYWRFDEGTGDVAYDATAYGNHGRLGTAVGPDGNDRVWTVDVAPIAPAPGAGVGQGQRWAPRPSQRRAPR